MGDFSTNVQQFPVCPHCGHEHVDEFYEYTQGNHNCEKCEKLFAVLEVETVMYFTTGEAQCARCEGELDLDHRVYCKKCLTEMAPDQVPFYKAKEKV